jgi:Uncharacterized protein containing a Zn-ribbon (DUF2116)
LILANIRLGTSVEARLNMAKQGSIRQKIIHEKWNGKNPSQARVGLRKRWQRQDEEQGYIWPRKCANCSKTIEIDRYGQRFCSTKCRVKYHYDMKQRKKRGL